MSKKEKPEEFELVDHDGKAYPCRILSTKPTTATVEFQYPGVKDQPARNVTTDAMLVEQKGKRYVRKVA